MVHPNYAPKFHRQLCESFEGAEHLAAKHMAPGEGKDKFFESIKLAKEYAGFALGLNSHPIGEQAPEPKPEPKPEPVKELEPVLVAAGSVADESDAPEAPKEKPKRRRGRPPKNRR